jgi:hypothetical protein
MPLPDARTLKKPFRVGRSMRATSTKGLSKGEVGNKALRRFHGHAPLQPDKVLPLSLNHQAVTKGHTIFPRAVVEPAMAGRLLVSGQNSRKLGSQVTKGAWRGMPIFSLTLEERATCPRSCELWRTCYGNAMHLAKRIDHRGIGFEAKLQGELAALQAQHPQGFVVRLHQLGDFFSLAYVQAWAGWLARFPALRIFGYTHWPVDTKIGAEVARIREYWWDRFAVRTSLACPPQGQERSGSVQALPAATTIWRLPEGARVAEGIVCPAQTGKTECCGTCGLCWAGAARGETIVFVGHGMVRTRARGPDRQPRQSGNKGGRPRGYDDATAKRVLALVAPRDLTYDEIAAATGLTKGQIAGIVFRNRGTA